MKPFVTGRFAMVNGPRFDMTRVLHAQERLMDALVERFGPAQVCRDMQPGRQQFPWHEGGCDANRLVWEGLKKTYDAIAVPMLFLQRELTFEIRLLGMQWIVQDVVTEALKLHDGTSVGRLFPTPTLHLLGAWMPDDEEFLEATDQQCEAVEQLLTSLPKLIELGLVFDRATRCITFPHAVYGAGIGLLTAHCVSSDGGEPDGTNTSTRFTEN